MLFQVENLCCRRGMQMVFRDIDFTLDAGEALLVTGANGSGKSSLLRVLACLLPVEEGEMRWGGEKVDPNQHSLRLHYVGHQDAVKLELTVGEMLEYWRALRPFARVEASAAFGLKELKDKPVRFLSAGQRRRLALARLTMDDAPLWLLDEPATSLDQAGQELLNDIIRQHRAKGGIAIVATHHSMKLRDAQELVLAGDPFAGFAFTKAFG